MSSLLFSCSLLLCSVIIFLVVVHRVSVASNTRPSHLYNVPQTVCYFSMANNYSSSSLHTVIANILDRDFCCSVIFLSVDDVLCADDGHMMCILSRNCFWTNWTKSRLKNGQKVKLIPRLHDEAGSTSWLYERSSSQLVEPASSCKRGIRVRDVVL